MLRFRPLIDEPIKSFLNEKKLLRNFSNATGGYVDFLFPENLTRNTEAFKSVFSKYHLNGKIFFAHKVNKSNSLVAQAESLGILIDVASVVELNRALCNGFTGNRIEITGSKPLELIILGIKHGVIFNVDNINELKSIIKVTSELNQKTNSKILLRIGSFECNYIKMSPKDSKFGFSHGDVKDALEVIFKNSDKLNFLGFSFHLDTIEIKEKIVAIENCLYFFEVARNIGLEPSVINIGGGFKVSYIKEESDWNNSISKIKEAMLTQKESYIWGNGKFGLYNDKGTLRGSLNIYNYFDKITGSNYLDLLLSTPMPAFENRPVGTVLCENMIDIYIEPGRAIVEQVGITATKITQVKESPGGELIAVLNIRRNDLVFADQEIFVDPIVISNQENENSSIENIISSEENIGLYLAGCLCLESDFVYRHKIFLSKMPQAGDIVVFINTAGYYMDFNHMDNLKVNDNKIVITKQGTQFKWYKDAVYNPILNKILYENNEGEVL